MTAIGVRIPAHDRNAQGDGPLLWYSDNWEYMLVIEHDLYSTVYQRAAGTTDWGAGSTAHHGFGLEPLNATDGHHRLTIARDGLGHIHILGNVHGHPLNYAVSIDPDDITEFEDGNSRFDPSATGTANFTYPTIDALSDGTLIMSMTQQDSGSVLGRDSLLWKLGPTDTNWSPHTGTGELLTCDQVEDNGDPERAYANWWCIDPDDNILVFGVWQWQANDQDTRTDAFFIRWDATDEEWQTIDGGELTLPITYAQTSTASNCELPNQLAISLLGWTPTWDAAGYPHVILGGYLDRRHYWWDGSEWQHEDLGTDVGHLIQMDGEVWTIADILRSFGGDTLYAWNLKSDANERIVSLGRKVPSSFSPRPQPQKAKEGRLALAVPVGNRPSVIHWNPA